MAQIDPQFFMEITRIDDDERIVEAYGTRGDMRDSYGTLIDLDSAVKCMSDYMEFPSIREMHDSKAAGKTVNYEVDDKGIKLSAKIVDDDAWKKVKEEVYRGFSVGGKQDFTVRAGKNIGRIKPDKWQDGDVIHLASITEYSLVDTPSNKGCGNLVYRISQLKEAPEMEPKADDTARADDAGTDKKAASKVNYSDAANKKYPLDSAKHIKAAWSYINMPKNAKKYDADELSAVKDKIVAAWKETIDKDGPPSAEDDTKKSAETGDVARGTWVADSSGYAYGKYISDETDDCQIAICALQTIKALLDKESGELHPEAQEQIDRLAAAISAIKDFIQSEIMEDDDDVAQRAAASDIERKGAAISATNLERIQTMHDHCADMGAVCRCADVQKADGGDDVTRIASMADDIKRLAGDLDIIRSEKETLVARVAELEKEPVNPKAALLAVDRANDIGTGADTVRRLEDTAEYKGGTDIQRAQLRMKESLTKPQQFYR